MIDAGEQALAARAKEGDAAAFGELVRRYQGPVYRLCRRYVDAAEAEDLAQESFVRAFINVHKLDATRPLSPWLLTIARRLCLDRLRRKKARPTVSSDELAEPSDGRTSEGDLATRQTMAQLAIGLQKLPDGQREAVLLFHVEGLAYRDIADVLEVPMGTVMTWLHRARARLKAQIGELPDAPRAPSPSPSPLTHGGEQL